MASATPTISDKIENASDSAESQNTSPIPPKRKTKAKCDDASAAVDSAPKSGSEPQITPDNSRVVFVDEVITKSEVTISTSDAKDDKNELTACTNTIDSNLSPDCQVIAGNTKSKIASFLEKANVPVGGSQFKIVMTKVNVNNGTTSREEQNNIIVTNQINGSTVKANEVMASDQNLESITISESKESTVMANVETIVKETSHVIVTEAGSVIENGCQQIASEMVASSQNAVASQEVNGIKSVQINNIPTVIVTQDSSREQRSERENVSESITKQETTTENIESINSYSNEKNYQTVTVKQSMIATEEVQVSNLCIKESTESEKESVEVMRIEEKSNDEIVVISDKVNSTNTSITVNDNDKPIVIEAKSIIKEANTISTQTEPPKPAPASKTSTKPTLMKKPTITPELPKLQKVPSVTKIPMLLLDKAVTPEKEKTEIFKVKRSKASLDKSAMFESEPKLTKKQRTSSEQCLSLSKSDSEQATSKKLRTTIELLQHENSTIKKLLESERSAFREYRAVHETEAKKEKAEARRREASLEGQLRAALKGPSLLMKSASTGDASFPDAARLATALENAKSANKSLQEKLQVVIEADKRKAGELRAQHDAHAVLISQMERDSRTQLAKLLEELKSKERQIEQLKKGKGTPTTSAPPKGPTKMAVADQLHFMEGQISRLEHEIQRRDDIIQTLRSSKVRKDRRLSGHQMLMKDSIFKDLLSDVDSAVSSAPNSLSPQPSPDLWYHPHDPSQTDAEDGLLEAAKKQIQDLEKALGLSTVSQQSAQMRASQLEEQLQDLREHADLLEFRCLELEDASEKRNSLEELTDSDSGCTSPENRLKNSVSPQLRRSDSGYKSPTRPSSPNRKNQRILTTPTASFSECEPLPFSDSHKGGNSALAGDVVDSAHDPEGHSEDIKYRLERMMLKTHSESDRSCLEQVLQLLWNLQALSGTLADEDYSMIKHKKILDGELNKSEFEQTKSGKIIATISPYSQKSSNKPTDLIRSASSIEPDHVSVLLKEDSKKVAYGLQESGIFEESDWESKETQTEWCDCACAEPESDLATEVQRLNQIREQLEKSGAIRSKNLRYKHRGESGDCQVDLKQQRKRDKKKLELYESRIAVLENKISIYESSNDVRDKKLAQRLQREIDLQSKSKNLEFDLSKLRKKYLALEEERCELEEAENDTRLHCQELEAEFDILTAKLRDVEDQRGGAAESAECYRALAEEYEYRNMDLQKETRKLTEKVNMMEKTIPALVCYNLYNIMRDYSANSKEACCAGGCRSKYSKPKASKAPVKPLPMIGYKEPTSMSVDQPSLIIEQCSSNVSEIKPALTDTVNSGFSGLNSISIKNDSKTIEVHPKKSSLKSGNSQMSNFSQEHNVCDCQEYARYRIEELMVNEMKMKQRIEELEKRELAFLETLTKGDEMWADMEFSYKQKIKENEENEALLEQDRNRWKTKYEELQVKVQEMEENESTHKYEKRKFQEEMKDLSKQKELLSDQVVSSQMELLQAKSQMETNDTDLRRELMAQKRVTEEIQEELKEHKKLQMDTEEVCKGEVVQLKRDMCRAAREMREQELTIGELLQEVHNLEKKLIEVSDESVRQRAELNEKNKSLLCEIKCKTNEVDNMKREIAKVQGLPSAEEELNQSFKRAAKNCKCGAPFEGKRAAKNCKCPIQEHVVRHFEVEEDEMQLPLINQLTKIEKSPEMAKMYKYCKENAEDSLPKTLMYKYCKENAEDSVPKALMHKYCRENIDNEESKAQEYNYNRENIEKAYQKQIEIEEIKIIDNIDRQKQDSIKSVPKHPEIANQKVPPKPIAAKPTVPQNVPKTPQVKPKPTETKPSQPKKPATQPAASQKETHKPKEDHPKETSKSKEVHFTERTHQTEKVHEIVHREKPELPKRKPKVTPTVQATPQTSTKPGAAKKEDTSPKNIGGLPTPPMQLVDRGDNARCQVEDNVCRMLNDSLNCCLDERTAPISQGTPNAQENDGSLMSQEAQRVREISEKVKHPYEEISETGNEAKNIIQKAIVRSNSSIVSNDLPMKESPKLVNINLKRYHSLSESRSECIKDLPTIMSKSDSVVTYNTASAKELIASFNRNMNTNNATQDSKPPKQAPQPPKAIGSLVFDRVTRLTNSLGNAKIQMGLKRSVSMIADSTTAPTSARAVFVYADL